MARADLIEERERMAAYPSIILGGPLRDRAWICGEWLIALLNQNYPPEKMRVVLLLNDSHDETREICEWIRDRYGWMVADFQIVERNFGCTHDNNNRLLERDYGQFARARNAWLAQRRPGEWCFSVDSDVLCPPETLPGLVANGLDLCAAVIENNWCAPNYHTNCLRWWEPEKGPDEGAVWIPEAWTKQEVFPCDLTGACFLIAPRVLDAGVRYGYHWGGEDGYFCWAAQQQGFQLFADGRLHAEHKMKPPVWTGYQSRRHLSMYADLAEWRLEFIENLTAREDPLLALPALELEATLA